jgi:hypothetical protein
MTSSSRNGSPGRTDSFPRSAGAALNLVSGTGLLLGVLLLGIPILVGIAERLPAVLPT